MRIEHETLRSALEGRYTVLRRVGEGAMATVWLAEDMRHRRNVAIKVLKPDLAAVVGADRFLAEIRTTASLHHPHILPLFDSGEAGGFLFYVMPFIAGESLRDRLSREKQLPVDDAVAIARAVAGALDHAHRRGIVHRDIKPDNILLHDGEPLVADFGIALAVSSAGGGRLTETGMSIGTPPYMSPEQAAGDGALDGRSDLYALAAVLYEMLAGQPPFSGPTSQAVIARVLAEPPPPLMTRRPSVPAHVAAVVVKGLEKAPADRFETGDRFVRALADQGFRWPPGAAGSGRAAQRGPLLAALVLAAVMTAVAGWSLLQSARGTGDAPTPLGLTFALPPDQTLATGRGLTFSVLEISPRGDRLVYAGRSGADERLYIRELAEFQVRPLDGTSGAAEPFFSPDGEWIAFFAEGELRKVPAAGGIVVKLADAPEKAHGGTWAANGTILYSLGGSSLWRVSENGGVPVELPLVFGESAPAGQSRDARPVPAPVKWPRFLPGEKHALAAVGWVDQAGNPNQAGLLGVVDLATGEFSTLLGGSRPHYLEPGYIVFDAGTESVNAVPFDLDRLAVTGPVIPLVQNALRSPGAGTNFTVSDAGILAYPAGGFDRTLVIVDRLGRESPIAVAPRGYRLLNVSPDGRNLLVTVDPQPPQIWVVDLRDERAGPITTDGYNLGADWSMDGRSFTWLRIDVERPGIYMIRWPVSDTLTFVSHAADHITPRAARDNQLFVQRRNRAGDIIVLDIVNGTETELAATSATERQPALSPDGNWVAYVSDVTGIDEVYVIPYSGRALPKPVSSGGGMEPRWSHDGTELYFRSGNSIRAVRTAAAPEFELAGVVETLFTGAFDFSSGMNWDVLPDGRFVMVKSDPRVGREIRLEFHWLDDLRAGGPRAGQPSAPGR